jgi:predicted DsbA family dithiol-disulfide isomerase
MPLTINVWSDVVCPWCYVGKRRLEAALARFDHKDQVEITWHSFELDPSAPKSYEGQGTQAERLAKKYRMPVQKAEQMMAQMTKTAAVDGIEMNNDRQRGGNTFDAHRLLHWAHAQGRQNELKERLFKGYFTDGEAIAEPNALAKLASEVGLDEEQARAVLLSDQYSADVRADEENARQLGISGVPFFVVGGKYAVSGAQPAEVLAQVLERAWSEQKPELVASGPNCDGDVCT